MFITYIRPASTRSGVQLSPHILLPSPAAGFLSPAPSRGVVSDYDTAYSRFLHDYPQYASSLHVAALRRSEYSRLGPDETYVDYMGGALYPTSLISVHAEFLQGAVLGNTHSESPSSKLSAALPATARAAVFSFLMRHQDHPCALRIHWSIELH
ncbi:hypothetical protein BJY52DRAFT_1248413 [Lactarius psammicola]|nr:hypothetical protein BJY52DRAFT_1248413 [Lactarius psammicola]